jgi:hypothetical protein
MLACGNTLRFKFREDQRKDIIAVGEPHNQNSEEKRNLLLEDELIDD